MRNSKIIIAKGIKMDRSYTNILDYNESSMIALLNSTGHYVNSADTFSFIRGNGTINADFPFEQCSICNYMAFQNPEYFNKWFFAWIDEVEYRSERNVVIHFTVDLWSTWHNDITLLPCFVEREHVDDDSYRMHTLQEPLGVSDLLSVEQTATAGTGDWDEYYLIISFAPQSGLTSADLPYRIDNKYLSPCRFYSYPMTLSGMDGLIHDFNDSTLFAGDGSNIVSMFCFPKDLLPSGDYGSSTDTTHTWMNGGKVNITTQLSRGTSLGSYTPKNNKMLIFPYNRFSVDAGNVSAEYKPELFSGDVTFTVSGAAVPNGNVTCYPVNYDGVLAFNPLHSVTINDFPMVAFPTDTFKAWLAQKSSSTILSGLTSIFSGAAIGAMHGGLPGAAIGAGTGLLAGVTSYISQAHAAKEQPNSAVGSDSTTMDILNGLQGFKIKRKYPKPDECREIDHYFSMYGYNVSTVKIPNMSGRQYWNYVKTAGEMCCGDIPEQVREGINSIFTKGVTIWHGHDYCGNYLVGDDDLDNPII